VDRTWHDAAAVEAAEIAREAGELIRSRFHAPREIGTKSASIDLVTDTDRAADRLIAARLASRFPGHGRISEESGGAPPPGAGAGSAGSDEVVHWIIDPLDGTTNFAHGFPHFAVSIAAVVGLDPAEPLRAEAGGGARVVVGVVYDPMRDELFAATEGGGATLNGRAISVSTETSLDASLFATGFPYDRRERADLYLGFWRAMMLRCRDVRRVGAAALDLAWVACGRLDGFWEWNLHAWDVAAGALIVRRAGGHATDFSGTRDLIVDARQTLATNRHVHAAALEVIRPLVAQGDRSA
jgi:myo-inositol-1(or 4)-monophosphatase